MLVVLYIVSTVSGVLSSIYKERENSKPWLVSTLVAILTSIAFCLPMINRIVNNLTSLDFWSIFGVLSLIVWQVEFLFGNCEKLLDYEVAVALLAFDVCFLSSMMFTTNVWETCTDPHITTEVVYLMTTIDGNPDSESVYGNGFIVGRTYSYVSSSRNSSYMYYYQLEDGTPCEGEIPVYATEIDIISNDETPYLEIITIRDCSGYNPKTGIHSIGFAEKTYILHIPENSILTIVD